MPVRKHDFQNWASLLGQTAKCSPGQTFNPWLVLAKFNCIRLIENARSILCKGDNIEAFMPVTRSFNVWLEEPSNLQNDYSIYDNTITFEMRNMKDGGKLFLNEGAD